MPSIGKSHTVGDADVFRKGTSASRDSFLHSVMEEGMIVLLHIPSDYSQ